MVRGEWSGVIVKFMIKSFTKGGRNGAFTLIELLVVVSIIGLLASIVVVSMGGIRQSGRDARGISDIKQIQTAVELTYDFSTDAYVNLPENWTDITNDPVVWAHITEIQKSVSPIPTGTGSRNYKWCDGGAGTGLRDVNTYKLGYDLEADKAGDATGDCFIITEKGTQAVACTNFNSATANCNI